VAIVAPFYYKISQEGVYAYFAEIAKESPIDLTLYNIPQFANDISNETILRLAGEFPRIVGIKDSSRDLPRFLNLMHDLSPLRPDFVYLIGCEEMLLPFLLMGGDGGTIATSGVVPEVIMKLYTLAQAGRLEEARAIQYKVLDLIKLIVFGAALRWAPAGSRSRPRNASTWRRSPGRSSARCPSSASWASRTADARRCR
jgi:4-hydroxy-tetrahydrodipicolinate synthase